MLGDDELSADEVRAEADATKAAIRAWRFPDGFVERQRASEGHWERLRQSVVTNCLEGFEVMREQLAANRPDLADQTLGLVQRRWRLWLQQVQRASHDRLLVQPTAIERANNALNRYYDSVEHFTAGLPSPGDVADGLRNLALAAAAIGVLMLMRKAR